MDHKISGDTVIINEVFSDSVVEKVLQTDFTLPDYCPDIGKILKCRATPRITVRTLTASSLEIEGITRIDVIYLDGRDKHIRSCDHEIPFSASIPFSDYPEKAEQKLEVKVEYVNCRAISQRRVDIRGAISIRTKITARKNTEILSDAQGAGIRLRRKSFDISSCIGHIQTPFTISEALELASGKPPIASVIRSSAYIKAAECKAIANKLIIKGEAILRIVYTTEPDGGVESMEYSLPFNQFIDMQGVNDSCISDCSVNVTSLEINLRTDSDGEYRRINADIRAVADVSSYIQHEITVVCDAYSVDCELRAERQFLPLEKFLGNFSIKNTAALNIEFEKEISRILDIWCEPGDFTSAVRGNSIAVSGNITLCAIAGCTDDDKEYSERTVKFECTIPMNEAVHEGNANISVYIQNCSYTMAGASVIAVKCEIECNASVRESVKIACITDIEPDETKVKNHTEEPALVVYYASSGEELWDIAREHNASVETIKTENDLNEDTIAHDIVLLISVR